MSEIIKNRLPVDGIPFHKDDARDTGDQKFDDIQVGVIQSREAKDNLMPVAGDPRDLIVYFNDFISGPIDDTTGVPTDFVETSDAGATLAVAYTDAKGGFLQIPCDGDDNDECYLSSRSESFIFETDKKLWFRARFNLTEAATDDANIIIGLSNTVAANSLVDNGAGPMASYDGAVFYKVDGTMSLGFESSNAGTQVTSAALADFVSATNYEVAFYYDYNDGVTGYIYPYIDGIKYPRHEITISGLEEMHLLLGVKAGGANEEALMVDYIKIVQER